MHFDGYLPGCEWVRNLPLGIVCGVALRCVPFEGGERLVVVGIDDGETCFCEWYPAEWVAIADAAVEKKDRNGKMFYPGR